jgi:hypothetical protein
MDTKPRGCAHRLSRHRSRAAIVVLLLSVSAAASAQVTFPWRDCPEGQMLKGEMVGRKSPHLYEVVPLFRGVIGTHCEMDHGQGGLNGCFYADFGWREGSHALLRTRSTTFDSEGNFELCVRRETSSQTLSVNGFKKTVKVYDEDDGSSAPQQKPARTHSSSFGDTLKPLNTPPPLLPDDRFEDGLGVYRVCVGKDGRIYRVDIVKRIPGRRGAEVSSGIAKEIRTKWRYEPVPKQGCFEYAADYTGGAFSYAVH